MGVVVNTSVSYVEVTTPTRYIVEVVTPTSYVVTPTSPTTYNIDVT
tara:strand:- start:130 stop:267 length:138 start_codon:yes stop_codon:yes gene_type:complete